MENTHETTPLATFFDLPRELRDQIYHEAFNNGRHACGMVHAKHYNQSVDDHSLRAAIKYNCSGSRNLQKSKCVGWGIDEEQANAWIFASKQIFEEVRKQFMRNATCVYSPYSVLLSSDFGDQGSKLATGVCLDLTPFEAFEIQDIGLGCRTQGTTSGELDDVTGSVELDESSTEFMHVFRRGLNGNIRLRRLSLVIDRDWSYFPKVDQVLDADLQIKTLDFPNLDFLDISVALDDPLWKSF